MTTQINRDFLKGIRAEIDEALKAIAEKHNVSLKTGNGGYDRDYTNGHFKLEIHQISDDGEVIPTELKDLRRLQPDAEGKTVIINGKSHTVVGYNVRARKNPFTIKDARGKLYCTSYEMVMSQIRKAAA